MSASRGLPAASGGQAAAWGGPPPPRSPQTEPCRQASGLQNRERTHCCRFEPPRWWSFAPAAPGSEHTTLPAPVYTSRPVRLLIPPHPDDCRHGRQGSPGRQS